MKLCLFTNYAIYAYGQGWDKQGQSGTKWGQSGTIKGTSRGIQGQAGPGRDKLGQKLFPVPAFPSLVLLVSACLCFFFFIAPAYPNNTPDCPCLFLLIPVPWICLA